MARPKRSVEQTLYDLFEDWDTADQAACLRILTQLHLQKQRRERKNGGASPDVPTFDLREPSARKPKTLRRIR